MVLAPEISKRHETFSCRFFMTSDEIIHPQQADTVHHDPHAKVYHPECRYPLSAPQSNGVCHPAQQGQQHYQPHHQCPHRIKSFHVTVTYTGNVPMPGKHIE